MKFLSSQIAFFLQNKNSKRNIKFLIFFIIFLVFIITLFSVLFHFIMMHEGQEHSWITGFYWTLTVMTTLGFGDITFESDLGRAFSIIVLVTGVILLLVLLPFTLIQYLYSPWIEAQNQSRAPRSLESDIKDHIIFTSFDDITISLVDILNRFGLNYIILFNELQKALEYYDLGYKVGFGNLEDPETYEKMNVDKAKIVFSGNTDELNANIAFTIREISENVPIITTADSTDSVDILELAGSNLVLEPRKMIGEAFARRTLGGNALSSVIGSFDKLIIAEAPAMGTPLVGKNLTQLQLRKKIGVNVVGFWDHGKFILPTADYVINKSTVIVIAGTKESIDLYNEMFVIFNTNDEPVIIIGAGRVGKYVSNNLKQRDIDYVIIEKEEHGAKLEKTIYGNAADINVLKEAGVDKASSAIISTSSDDMNIYLTIYIRRLREDIQIIARANSDKNVSTMQRAGADIILSYPSLTANTTFNYLRHNKILMLSEGIDIFESDVPESLVGKTLFTSNIREKTGCNVLGIKNNGEVIVNPDPNIQLEPESKLILLANREAEYKFMSML